jgi:tRNA C32,U32 (ribose-2'-O)-methylase TrmJ
MITTKNFGTIIVDNSQEKAEIQGAINNLTRTLDAVGLLKSEYVRKAMQNLKQEIDNCMGSKNESKS